MSEDLFL